MPIYEYLCQPCNKSFSFLLGVGADAGEPETLNVTQDAVPLPPPPAPVDGGDHADPAPAPAVGEPNAATAADLLASSGGFGILGLTLPGALELSYIHSREYQTAIEDVYLTALDLSFERYQFNLRLLGFAGEPTVDLEYRSTPDGPNGLPF